MFLLFFSSKVGSDVFGKDILNNFNKCGVNTQYILTKKSIETGVAQINVTDNGDKFDNNYLLINIYVLIYIFVF